mgnify:CR=1 FL=1
MYELRTDDTAVSPVIGVILMVAITVLLASTAAVFFLEFGNGIGSSTQPTAAFETDYSQGNASTSDEVTFSHQSGDNLDTSELQLVVEGDVDTTVAVESVVGYRVDSSPEVAMPVKPEFVTSALCTCENDREVRIEDEVEIIR